MATPAKVLELVDLFNRNADACRRGFTSIGRAMHALDRLPLELLGRKEAEGIGQAIDRQALTIIDGPARGWIYRTLESIRDEHKLRRTLLRLFQNSVPRYAQIRHGPIEYGKDIAVAIPGSDRVTHVPSQVWRHQKVKRELNSTATGGDLPSAFGQLPAAIAN